LQHEGLYSKAALEAVPDAPLTQCRHAWGIEANQEQAVHYLSMAASNSAEVEKLALGAGMKKGGSAKGELVLAMYELANCFRNGWGIKKDPAAAKQYYETAANLGDTDAMNEVAWCYTEGFGTKKDKVRSLHCVPWLLGQLLSRLSAFEAVYICYTVRCGGVQCLMRETVSFGPLHSHSLDL
jgi:TPR repeat protein